MASNEVRETHHRAAYQSPPGWRVVATLKRAALVSALMVAVVAVLVLIIVSPLVLRQLDSLRGVNWTRLSSIGQTYGAASALLTGLALVGVAGSMVFQVRAIRVSREQPVREHHAHLIEMSLADPVYQRCWGDVPAEGGTPDWYRQSMFLNLIISMWENNYSLGSFPEHAMRITFARFFDGEAGRSYWAWNHNVRLQLANNRRDKRFCHIMEEEYQKAIAAGPATVESEVLPLAAPPSQRLVLHNSTIKTGVTLVLGAVGGIAFRTLLRHADDKRSTD